MLLSAVGGVGIELSILVTELRLDDGGRRRVLIARSAVILGLAGLLFFLVLCRSEGRIERMSHDFGDKQHSPACRT